MTPFEYVSVLVSIILGLGITQIMSGIADLVHQWNKVKLYWPHSLWILFIFIMHIQEWWITYELRTYTSWRLPTFLFFILYPVNLFILARILFPISSTEHDTDMKAFYFANFRKFFLLTTTLSVLAIISNILVEGLHANQFIQLILIALLGVVAWRKITTEWVHKVLSLLLVFGLLIAIIIYWNIWLIN
ncbi:MAG: hypothetical protein K2U26_17975 [Cyclobacteriaceae bacterium]|nr:hypothetical protein [Cyclobacteriaceae bacterium]